MKIQVICVGKTQQAELKSWLPDYCKRLTRFTSFDWHEIPDLKNTKNIPEKQQKTDEGKLILGAISHSDTLVIFDEKGSTYTSKGFSQFIQKKMNAWTKKLVFVIGGP